MDVDGYHTALAEARALIGVAPDAPLRLVRFPRRQPVLALLRGESELERGGAEVIDGVFALAVPLIGDLRWPLPEAGVLALVEEHLQEQ